MTPPPEESRPDSVTAAVMPVAGLLAGVGILLLGNGLQNILLPTRAALEGISTAVIGLVMAPYFVGFVAGCVLVPRLVRRVGHIRAFAILAAVASSAALAYALAVEPVFWAALRVASGFAFSGLYTVIESWLNEKAANRNRGRILSVYRMVDLASTTGGQLLLNLDDPMGFPLFCAVSILICLALVPVALTTASSPQPIGRVQLRLVRLYRQSPLGVVGCFAVGLVNGAFWSLAPVFAQRTGLSAGETTYFMSAVIVGGAALQLPLGRLSDFTDRRLVLTATAAGAAGASLTVFAAAGAGLGLLLAAAFVFGGMAFPLYSLAIALANDRVERADFVEAASGLLLVYGIGAIIGPVAASQLMAAFGPPMLFAYAAAIYVAATGFGVWRMARMDRVPGALQEAFVAVPRSTPAVFELDPRAARPPEG
jgi:MFS family permease